MAIYLRITLILVSFLTNFYILHKIKKSQMKIEATLYWIAVSVLLLILSLIPNIAVYMSSLMGVESPVNLVFLIIIFILFIKVFSLSIKISDLENKNKRLTQEIALQNYELKKVLSTK